MIAIMGYGFVGKGTEYLLQICGYTNQVQIHDPAQGHTVTNWEHVEYAFVCVPTPESETGDLDLSILTEVYQQLLDNDVTPIIRSTIGPDQVAQFPEAIMMPEFLREANWVKDVEEITTVILGGDGTEKLERIFTGKTVIHTDPVTAMMYKLSRNALLATKVILANQIKTVCERLDADYTELVKLFNNNNTLGQTHWDVPGPDGKLGFGGKCFPKDISHMSTLYGDDQDNIFNFVKNLNNTLRGDNNG